jgi:ATP-dependent Clp protease protease subunit
MKYQNVETTMKNAELNGVLLPLEDLEYLQNTIDRKIFVNSDIYKEIMDVVQMIIQDINEDDKDIPIEERKPLRLYLDSNGGELYPTLATIDMIKMSKTPIWTICKGTAYSSAGLLLLAGHKRFCYKHSSFLLHSGSNGFSGKTDSVFDNLEFEKKVTEKLVKEHVISNSNIDSKTYDRKYRHEWFMSSEDMLKYGIVDEIADEII